MAVIIIIHIFYFLFYVLVVYVSDKIFTKVKIRFTTVIMRHCISALKYA